MIARENLLRTAPFEIVRADAAGNGDGLTLEGYAAVFGQATEIDSWEGAFSETIRKGAFRKSIRENTPVLQFDHGQHPLIGSIPIGAITDLREDDQGLHVVARLSDNWLIEPVRDAIAERSVKGMSFRFSVVREEWRDNAGKLVRPDELDMLLWSPGDRGPLQRTMIELKCRELGPVVFPAYVGTSVDVRAAALAEEIRSDGDLRREVRAALARQAPAAPPAAEQDLDDPGMRREVARALLFGSEAEPIGSEPTDPETPDAPPEGHPSAARSEDAPAAEGHPSAAATKTDAPPSGGHPSATDSPSRQDVVRSRIHEITELMDERLATIRKDA